MGREIRRVPEKWEHPKRPDGNYIPLMGYSDKEQVPEWDEEKEQWAKGFRRSFADDSFVPIEADVHSETFEEWTGNRPEKDHYMPEWPDAEKTHIQMYEDCSEGTPISPVMKTPEELARWLADNNASSFGSMTETYEQWLSTCKRGWAMSATIGPEGFKSGVESLAEEDD